MAEPNYPDMRDFSLKERRVSIWQCSATVGVRAAWASCLEPSKF